MIGTGSRCRVGYKRHHDFLSSELKSLSILCEDSEANPRNHNWGLDLISEA